MFQSVILLQTGICTYKYPAECELGKSTLRIEPIVSILLAYSEGERELLTIIRETIASENESYYLEVLGKIGGFLINEEEEEEEIDSESYTDQELYTSIFDLLTPYERSLYDIPLANKYYSPRIISHYRYYNTTVIPSFEAKLNKKCGHGSKSWVQYNNVVYCNPDDVYALMTDGKQLKDEKILLPFDRVIGSSGPILAFYADVKDPNFRPFLRNLYESSQGGKFRFVWRYIPSETTEKEVLSGYGIDLTLKRTDYIVIDDRDIARGPQQVFNSKVPNSDSFLDKYHEDIRPIKQDQLEDLDLKIASFALSSENHTENFQNLLSIVQDLPKFTADLSDVEINADLIEQLDKNLRIGLTPENSALFINGKPLSENELDVFSLYKNIKEELNQIERLKELGIDSKTAKNLISKFALYSLFKNRAVPGMSKRYSVESDTSPIIYFNDIETDPIYDTLPSDISVYLQRYAMGQVPPFKANLHTVVFVINLSNEDHLKILLHTVNAAKTNLIAQRIGVIPIVSSEDDTILGNNLFHIVEKEGVNKAFKYLKNLKGEKPVALTTKNYIADLVTPFVQNFDTVSPTLIVNGVFYDLDDDWPYSLTRQVSQDVNYISSMVYSGGARSADAIIEVMYEDGLKLRNTIVDPDDKSLLEYKLITKEFQAGVQASNNEIFEFTNNEEDDGSHITLTLGGNLGSKHILQQLVELIKLIESQNSGYFRVRVINTSDTVTFIGKIRQALNTSLVHAIEVIEEILKENQFIESSTTNPVIEQLLESIDVNAAQPFILLDGRYIQLPDTILKQNVLQLLLDNEVSKRISSAKTILKNIEINQGTNIFDWFELYVTAITRTYFIDRGLFNGFTVPRYDLTSASTTKSIIFGDKSNSDVHVILSIDPALEISQKLISLVQAIKDLDFVSIDILLTPQKALEELPVKRFYRGNFKSKVDFHSNGSLLDQKYVSFDLVPEKTLFTLDVDVPSSWIVTPKVGETDLDNVLLTQSGPITGIYELQNIVIEGNAFEADTEAPPTGLAVQIEGSDTYVMTNYGYLQLKANPGLWDFSIREGRSSDIYSLVSVNDIKPIALTPVKKFQLPVFSLDGLHIYPRVIKNQGKANDTLVLADDSEVVKDDTRNNRFLSGLFQKKDKKHADINIFTIASGHLYERLLSIMTVSVTKNTDHSVKFWLIDNYMSPTFRQVLPHLAEKYGFEYELITYKWPSWLRGQREKQRTIWGYKILFLDVLFPQDLDKVIFVDADQIVRTDLKELVDLDLEGAPYGYTPMCDSRKEMEGFRFWKQGYWQKFLGDQYKYHISALYVIDLKKFRQIAAGDRLRQHYQALSRDPNSLSNLDQDLPNNLQHQLKIFSLPQDWLWCETWCDDQSLKTAKTIDLCNNPLTKEPKLDRARRQIPEWSVYDNEIGEVYDEVLLDVKNIERAAEPLSTEIETHLDEEDYEHDEF